MPVPREPFLPMLRELARCYQAFEAYSGAHVRSLGLTPSQFDIVATLGNTPGLSFKELGEKTLPEALGLPHGVLVLGVVLVALGGFRGATWVERRMADPR